jgi:hypothetical protein
MNMKKIIPFCFLIVSFFACSKSESGSKPQLKIKEIAPEVVALGSDARVILEFSDKEGDVTDSLLGIRERVNVNGRSRRPMLFDIPTFPNRQTGEIEVSLTNQSQLLTVGNNPVVVFGQRQPDTLDLKFVVRDAAKNVSDTAIARIIVIR